MKKLEKRPAMKKVVNWGKGLVVFITKEARELEWDDRTYVKVTIEQEDGKKYMKLEKAARL